MDDHLNKVALITGITGQDGAYLAKYLLEKKYKVVGLLRKKENNNFNGLAYLGILDHVEFCNAELTNLDDCRKLIAEVKPDEIYNLAAQSSVSYSFRFPGETIVFNIKSVLNLLEAIRLEDNSIKFYQASSSEMFGKAANLPISRGTTLHPLSPYAISKATGHWLVSQYRESYGLFAASGILFNHESYLRPESFFVKKVILSAIRIRYGKQENLIVGNIDVKRDFGYAKEYVKAIWLILQEPIPDDYQVCSGKSVSLREIIYYVFDHFGLDKDLVVQDKDLFRPSEIEDMYGDNTEIKKKTGWDYNFTFFDVLDILIAEEVKNYADAGQA
ncbi:MAG TPA: GDP-mannose 4,6-dehydratase [Saprospiraceae bacterium]|nr:GDP-mannose 4,6-dehydratase [Saprospiraceae bacterium]